MRISVVVPATDRPPTLVACVDAVRTAMPPGGELIVVTDPGGCGPAEARNEGAARAAGEVIVFVDADVIVEPNALARIEAGFAADPELTGLFGSYDDQPAARPAVSRFRNLLHHHVHVTSAGPARTFWAGLGAVRRDAFEAAGGFDSERFPRPAVEDIDLGMRLTAAGGRITLEPAVRGKHLKRWTLASMIATDFTKRGVPWTLLLLERGVSPDLNLSPRRRLGALAAVGAAGFTILRRPRAAFGSAASMVALNAPFYALLARQGGVRLAAAGIPLEIIHNLTAAGSVPVGVAAHLRRRRSRSHA